MASFVVKRKSSGKGWKLHQQIREKGKRREPVVPEQAYPSLGFSLTMSLDEARARASQLNAQKRVDAHRAANAARRVHVDLPDIESAYLPKDLEVEFLNVIRNLAFGSKRHEDNLKLHWKVARSLITELQIDPQFYAENRRLFYVKFMERKYSYSYVEKLLRIMNEWGKFVSRKYGRYFEHIPRPKGVERSKLDEAYEESKFYRAGGSSRLTEAMLRELKEKLPLDQGNFLHLGMWFGLRPDEIKELRNKEHWRIEKGKDCPVLWIYQRKLTAVPKPKRWKAIPCMYPEQLEGLEIIKSGVWRAPLSKTLKRLTEIDQISAYCGRKGFTDLMLEKGHDLVEIAMWLGHRSIERTWRNYKDKLAAS